MIASAVHAPVTPTAARTTAASTTASTTANPSLKSPPTSTTEAPPSNNNQDTTKQTSSNNPGDPATTPQQQQQLQALKSRDREVRAHELAHQSVGGQYVIRGAQFSYERGPDGRQYAVGGDVKIDSSPVSGDPQATINKAQTIQRAALAPANPSPTDRQVAARAAALMQQARVELALKTSEEQTSPGSQFDRFA